MTKLLTQQEWRRLVTQSERYEMLAEIVSKDPLASLEQIKGVPREQLDAAMDDRVEIASVMSRRAGGGCLCSCGREYRRHSDGGVIGVGDEQFLKRLCDGSLVKL